MERVIDDLTGCRFGQWVVLPRDDKEGNYRHRQCLVQCECGKLRLVPGEDLLNGRSQSCGCAARPKKADHEKAAARAVALRSRLHRVLEQVRLTEIGTSR
jgi:hypothetical protein